MSFVETPVFPEGLSQGSQYGPGYSTSQAVNLGGYRATNQNWAMPLYEGDVGFSIVDQPTLDQLLAFFHYVVGRQKGFRFKNWNDFNATAAQGTVVALGSARYQMYKTYTYGAAVTTRKITKPRSTAVASGPGSYSIDTTTGIITALGSPTVAPTGWSGDFDDPVQFNTDRMLPMWISFERYKWESIPIKEIRI